MRRRRLNVRPQSGWRWTMSQIDPNVRPCVLLPRLPPDHHHRYAPVSRARFSRSGHPPTVCGRSVAPVGTGGPWQGSQARRRSRRSWKRRALAILPSPLPLRCPGMGAAPAGPCGRRARSARRSESERASEFLSPRPLGPLCPVGIRRPLAVRPCLPRPPTRACRAPFLVRPQPAALT